ncbi:MAG: DUF4097 family beta strand repeat-containing protein [Saprospiraceae bacterium]
MKKSIFNSAILTLLFFLSITLQVFSQKENIKETFDNVQKIKVDVAVGNIAIEKSPSGNTVLTGEYDSEKLDVEISFSNGKLSVVEKTKKRNSNGSIDSHYKLQIPANLEMNLNTGTGDIAMASVTADANVNTGTGKIVVVNHKGDLKLNSGTGSVELLNSEGELSLNSGTGRVSMTNCQGELNANSGTDDVVIENVTGVISANSGTGNVSAKNINLKGNGNFNSGTGNVQLTITSPVTQNLSVNSGTGSATLDMNGQNFDGTLVMACGEPGGSISAPFDFDKEETKDRTIKKYKYFGDSGVELKVSTGSGKAKLIK